MLINCAYKANPFDIRLTLGCGYEFNIQKFQESTVDGDWDLKPIPFEISIPGILYRSLKQMSSGAKWEDTEYWRFLEESLKKGISHCGVKSPKDLHDRCYKRMSELVSDVKNLGRIPDFWNRDDMIGVAIGRDGRLILNNGRHRFSVAKFFNIQAIPVSVNVRHPKWVQFKNSIRQYSEKHKGIYAPISHIDFHELRTCHGVERIETIYNNIKVVHGSVLDIGAHWGHCCSYLSRKGFTCTAVEYEPSAARIMRILRDASWENFNIINGNVFDLPASEYDVVLALRIFHHFLKQKSTFDQMTHLLQRLRIQEMFFQPHDPKVQKMDTAYRNFAPKEFIEYIATNSGLRYHQMVGEFEGGPVFRLWR